MNCLSVFDHFMGLARKGLRLGEKFMETIAGVYFQFILSLLSQFIPLVSLCTPRIQKTSGFLALSRGTKRDQWHKIG